MLRKVLPIMLGLALGACAESATSPDLARSAASTSASAAKAESSGETIYGLAEGNTLISFGSGKVNQTSMSVQITGLAAGEEVVGIDFRPSDTGSNLTNDIGKLYALTDASRLYIVNPATGVASSPVTLSVPLVGTSFGIGFNPTVDRLRIHSDANQNLRVNVETGATTLDGALNYSAGDANFGSNPDITATAYTNNNAQATTTVLYAIDVAQDVLVRVSGPNTGVMVTVGALGVDSGLLAGFDISNSTGVSYAALSTSPSGKSTLYTIDLATGAATKVGMFAQTKSALLSIAVQP